VEAARDRLVVTLLPRIEQLAATLPLTVAAFGMAWLRERPVDRRARLLSCGAARGRERLAATA